MTVKHCPFCKTRDAFEAALIPMPAEYPCTWRCVACGMEFDRLPEPSAEEWLEDIEAAEDQLGIARVHGKSLFTGRDAFLDSNLLENRKR